MFIKVWGGVIIFVIISKWQFLLKLSQQNKQSADPPGLVCRRRRWARRAPATAMSRLATGVGEARNKNHRETEKLVFYFPKQSRLDISNVSTWKEIQLIRNILFIWKYFTTPQSVTSWSGDFWSDPADMGNRPMVLQQRNLRDQHIIGWYKLGSLTWACGLLACQNLLKSSGSNLVEVTPWPRAREVGPKPTEHVWMFFLHFWCKKESLKSSMSATSDTVGHFFAL